MKSRDRHTSFLKEQAYALGFGYCGVARAESLADEEAPRLEEWLKRGYHGKMKYMERHFDKRLDPTLLVPGAKSVVSLLYNYYPQEEMAKEGSFKISKYAYGEDYHAVVKDRLRVLMERFQQRVGSVSGRVFVDSAPVMERAWAQKSGLGWVGKNSLLLHPKMGSFFFLAEMIIDTELTYDTPMRDYCGSCTACMKACPTEAIVEPCVVDGSRCISYFTIELKEEIPAEDAGTWDDWIFGCDVCQDVCPWNRFAVAHREPRLMPNKALKAMDDKGWQEITASVFEHMFDKSAVRRAGFKGLKRTIEFLKWRKKQLA